MIGIRDVTEFRNISYRTNIILKKIEIYELFFTQIHTKVSEVVNFLYKSMTN